MKQALEHSLGVGKASKHGNNRKAGREQYYTPFSTAERLVREAQTLIPDLCSRLVIEPAAGTGSFVDAFKACGIEEILALDIDPKRDEFIKADFLKEFVFPPGIYNAVALTNPPFGRNSSLSVPFFNKLANHCSHIGFVVPKSWRKWSIQDRLDPRFHLLHDEELTIDYVDEAGNRLSEATGGLKTVFQIWEKKPHNREKKNSADHKIITRVDPAEADVSFTIFGRGCSTVKTQFERKPNTTQMFLKLNHPRALEALEGADFEQFYNNVAFVEALSWNEINYAINEYLALPLWAKELNNGKGLF